MVRVSPEPWGPPGPEEVAILWEGVCRLRVRGGRELDVLALPNAIEDDLALAVGGAGLALLLEQRGVFVLHGSCVAIGDAAICLMGPPGAGKSTLATALHRRGHALISDGMTAVVFDGSIARVLPGWPAVKLLPDAAVHLGFDVDAAPRVHSSSTKALCRIDAPAATSFAPPLKLAIALLAGHPPAFEPLGAGSATVELIRNFFLIEELGQVTQASIFERAAHLAGLVRSASLRRGNRLGEIDTAIQLMVGALA